MWRLKYLIIGMLPAAVLGVILYFLAPQMADALRDAVRESAQDAVTEVFEREAPDQVEPGQIVITESELAQAIENADRRDETWDVDNLDVIIENGRVRIVGIDDGLDNDQIDIASSTPQVVDGRLIMTDRSGVLSIFKSARDAIADQVETEIAAIFERSNVVPVSVTAENGRLVIVTEAADGGTSVGTTPSPQSGLGLRTPTPAP